jgi:hypothetical protein
MDSKEVLERSVMSSDIADVTATISSTHPNGSTHSLNEPAIIDPINYSNTQSEGPSVHGYVTDKAYPGTREDPVTSEEGSDQIGVDSDVNLKHSCTCLVYVIASAHNMC